MLSPSRSEPEGAGGRLLAHPGRQPFLALAATTREGLEALALSEARGLGIGDAGWEAFMELLKPLAEHNQRTYLHCLRVGIYSARLAAAHYADEVDPRLALHGGVGHDIGKLGIPVSVLEADPFGPSERRTVERHAVDGFLRLQGANYQAALVAGLHHSFQRDPYGLEPGEAIAPEVLKAARLVSICDFFDALVTRRDGRYPEASGDAVAVRKILNDNFPEAPSWTSWLTGHQVAA